MVGHKPITGDKFMCRGIQITIGEIDPAGKWAVINCVIPAHENGSLKYPEQVWDKRQPVVDGCLPADWEPVAAFSE
jgi:hypothetical protein